MQILTFFCEVLSHILSFMSVYHAVTYEPWTDVGLANLVPISSYLVLQRGLPTCQDHGLVPNHYIEVAFILKGKRRKSTGIAFLWKVFLAVWNTGSDIKLSRGI